MSEATVVCPKCRHEFAISEAVTASIESKLQATYLEETAKREKTIAAREQSLVASQAALAKAQAGIDEQVAARLPRWPGRSMISIRRHKRGRSNANAKWRNSISRQRFAPSSPVTRSSRFPRDSSAAMPSTASSR